MQRPSKILQELHYLPNLRFLVNYYLGQEVIIEAREHYQKGSYRNRVHLAGANGPLRLSIPLQKGKNEQMPIREVRIAYDEPWQKQHARSIRSAYRSAPFFDHYGPGLLAFYDKTHRYLFDFNLELLRWMESYLSLPQTAKLSDQYLKNPSSEYLDCRNTNRPKGKTKGPVEGVQLPQYVQVFAEKHGFLPNLSGLDLLFCTGPEAGLLLAQAAGKI